MLSVLTGGGKMDSSKLEELEASVSCMINSLNNICHGASCQDEVEYVSGINGIVSGFSNIKENVLLTDPNFDKLTIPLSAVLAVDRGQNATAGLKTMNSLTENLEKSTVPKKESVAIYTSKLSELIDLSENSLA